MTLPTKNLLEVWEWRGFWPAEANCFSLLPNEKQQAFTQATTQAKHDVYLLADSPSIIKCRKNKLEIKPFAKAHESCKAFHPKTIHHFPLAADIISQLFPQSTASSIVIDDIHVLAKQLGWKAMSISKKRSKITLQNKTQIEFCRFDVEGKPYHSFCIEGLYLDDILTEAQPLRQNGVIEMDYASFIRS
ncbi:MAG: hypothetical protein MK052_02685 [Alphaproteobacteria bacterium]|nr:hypothetical protein [Alphaproteobacteria bacterium]